MDQDQCNHSLVGAIIMLVHNFNLNLIAEGLGTEEQLRSLAAMQYDQSQGFS